MRTTFLLVLMLGLALVACGSGDGGQEANDTGNTNDTAADVTGDPGATDVTADPGKADPGTDPGTPDVQPDPGTPDVPADTATPDVPTDTATLDVPTDTATPDVPVDTGAPDVAPPDPPIVGTGHTGWREPKCFDCHDQAGHRAGLQPYQCAACHGRNGAPDGHKDGNCGCHGNKHGFTAAPTSCVACHPNL